MQIDFTSDNDELNANFNANHHSKFLAHQLG